MRTFLPSGRSQASKPLASNSDQRTHPNVCGAPNTTFDVLKKRPDITNLNEPPDHTLDADCSPTGALGERCSLAVICESLGGPTQDLDLVYHDVE
jgi:hypothetical protein